MFQLVHMTITLPRECPLAVRPSTRDYTRFERGATPDRALANALARFDNFARKEI